MSSAFLHTSDTDHSPSTASIVAHPATPARPRVLRWTDHSMYVRSRRSKYMDASSSSVQEQVRQDQIRRDAMAFSLGTTPPLDTLIDTLRLAAQQNIPLAQTDLRQVMRTNAALASSGAAAAAFAQPLHLAPPQLTDAALPREYVPLVRQRQAHACMPSPVQMTADERVQAGIQLARAPTRVVHRKCDMATAELPARPRSLL